MSEPLAPNLPDPEVDDSDIPQNFIDWYIDPLGRGVSTDPTFGFPLHLKCEDDFDWRLRFKVGDFSSTNPLMQLAQLSEIKFLMLEKGRFDGAPLATGSASIAWDQDKACYHMLVSLNGDALKHYITTLDATTTGFSTGGFDCTTAKKKAAGTVTTTTTSGGTVTETTAPGTPTPSALVEYEFMAEFRWVQNGKQARSKTFSIFVARDLITSTAQAVVIAPPVPPTDWRFFCTLTSEGTPFTGELFGYVKAPVQMEVIGLQVALQQPDAAAGFRIQLTDTAGTALGGGTKYYGDMAANTAFATLMFGQVLPLNQGGEIRAKILNYAGDSAAGLVINLICRQYLTSNPAGPSGPPGITSVTATTLATGAQATAILVGQQLQLGLPGGQPGAPGQGVTGVDVTTLAPNQQATAALAGTRLELGIPAGATGSYLHTSVGPSKTYAPGDNVCLTCTFTGVGKPALVLISFENADSVSFNQSGITFSVDRSDGRNIFNGDSTIAHVGNTYPFCFMAIDPLTATTPMTYTLTVHGFTGGGSGGGTENSGVARNPVLAILEIVN